MAPLKWRRPAALFVATVASILYTAALIDSPEQGPFRLRHGLAFTLSLLAILLTHEFGHFVFARHHGVNATLPHFIPLPLLSPFGTMGAVIFMRDRIRSRNALLDIGASGPLAGLAVAIPVLLYGLAHSPVQPLTEHGQIEGQSLLYSLLKLVAIGRIPEGYDVYLNPMARAGWAGLLVTMLNLLPVGQLDGGHVAYSLFGKKQNSYSRIIRFALLGLVPINFFWHMAMPIFRGAHASSALLSTAFSASIPWIGWFLILSLLERFSGGGHPPTEPGELTPVRKAIAVATLVLFVLLFMPTPWTTY